MMKAPESSVPHPPRLVYVLVSEPPDYFAEMAIVSIWAARHLMRNVSITVLTDRKTRTGLSGVRAMVSEAADEVRTVEVDDQHDLMTRSRWIKTTMRQEVRGDFLYLDCDAVPIRPLTSFGTEHVAAALDGNVPAHRFVFRDFEERPFRDTGWPFPIRPYFNGGVLMVRDTPVAQAFFEQWHALWQQSRRVTTPKDQPALNYANLRMGGIVQELPPQLNALTALYTPAIRGARIIHYTSIRFEERDDVEFIRVAKRLRESGRVDERTMLRVIESGYPWTDAGSVRNHILLGQYGKVPAVIARRVMNRLWR